MKFRFGPAGLGKVDEAIKNLNYFKDNGISACEIAFTYGPYIKDKDAKIIGDHAKKLGISLSIHGPYWINLNSSDEIKLKKSKERIIECLRIGTILGAKTLVFHPGFYGKDSKDKTYDNIKKAIIELLKESNSKGYTTLIAPEIMGKVNVFGSPEEIARLVNETGCSFCIDFAHILARDKDYRFDDVKGLFEDSNKWHVHFSGIVYGEKGEKHHKKTLPEEIELLLKNLPKDKEITIINESPDYLEDTLESIKIFKTFT